MALETSPRTARKFETSGRPRPMAACEIASFRKRILGVSQRLFADLMNVALQTVHAWEQGTRAPAGSAVRLLQLVKQEPKLLHRLLKPRDRVSNSEQREAQNG